MLKAKVIICVSVGLLAMACSHDSPPPTTPTTIPADPATDPLGPSSGSNPGSAPDSPAPDINAPRDTGAPPSNKGMQ
jgi:hypothetical protein